MSGEAGAPVTSAVLAALAGAGKAGLLAGEIRQLFSYPADTSRRQARVNCVLRQQELMGHVERLGKEPSPFYHNTPCYRWRITGAGQDYADTGGQAGRSARSHARRETSRADRIRRREEVAAAALEAIERAGEVPPGCRVRRDEVIIWARSRRLPLEWIAQLFGITRERARQIATGKPVRKRPQRCRCPACGAQTLGELHRMWYQAADSYGTSGGVELTDELIERLADEAIDYDPSQLRERR
jgi:hypothetical protein